jgi:hypothetical protein
MLGKREGPQMFVVWELLYMLFAELFTSYSLKLPSMIRIASQNMVQVLPEDIVISTDVNKVRSRK